MSGMAGGVGVVVCLEVPIGSEFGIDYEAFRTAEKFQGVKFIPSGLHFIFYSSNGDGANGIRQGFFIDMQPNDVIIRTWSTDTEELVPMKSEVDAENLTRAVHNFQLDGNLGAYPQKHIKTWHKLSKYITRAAVEKCGLTIGGTISPGDPDALSSTSTEALKPFFPDTAQTARFTPLRKASTRKSPQDLTAYHLDSSEHLEYLLETYYKNDWKALLGELQLAFVLFLLISSYDALNQWKQFVWLLCSCENAVITRPELFSSFLQVIHVHLEQVGPDFFEDEVANENFIKASLASLFEILHDDTLDPKLLQRATKLKIFLKDRFHLEFDVMGTYTFGDDECAPTVVLPDELPSYVFTQDIIDSEEENLNIAQDIYRQQRSC
ncbi:a1-alpha2 repression [Aphanomyces cochlioides]|nr:a1-alpha2 repression [Aphanomyces cochlioides]